VLQVDGERWLRAYGVNTPNATAAILVSCVVLLLPHLFILRGRAQQLVIVGCASGIAGMLSTFSRAAWLAFCVAMLVWLGWLIFSSTSGSVRELVKRASTLRAILPTLGLFLLIGGAFLVLNRPLVASRFFSLSMNPLEMASLEERARAARVALLLIVQNPWWGVGTGQFQAAGEHISPLVRPVHIAPLRAAAEFGLLGGLFWLWLAASPFLSSPATPSPPAPLLSMAERPLRLSPWMVLLLLSMFHLHLWLVGALHAPLLYALMAANASHPTLFHSLPRPPEPLPDL
jgi:O-antigen ligase